MRVAIVIAPQDFKDETVSKLKGYLGKWGIETVIASYSSKECVGYHGAVYKPDVNISRLTPYEYDALVLADGAGVDTYKLYDVRQLLDIVRVFKSEGKLIAGVNNAIKVIARSNIIADTKIAVPKDKETERLVILFKGIASAEDMESDKNILTLSNSDRTDEFVDMLIEKLEAK